ncbi:MAG: CbiX/SirB N-terminal domain-containing protein [Roseimicrobium sp.]
MLAPHSQAALVLVGHGSTVNPDSSTPTLQHADALRESGRFAEVVCAFWKEEPSMREVFYTVRSNTIYVVPIFISEGYFCQEVLPRELRLTGPVTQRENKRIFYCDPVGIHPGMTKLLLKRAEEVADGAPRSETSLIIVGHGTALNENSRKIIEKQVALIRDGGHGYAEVLDAYMEEAPFIAQWHELAKAPHVVVVPFFIADGLHSYQDIPVLLGIESEPSAAASQSEIFRRNPHMLHGRKLYYSSAVGTEPHMAEVILDQVHEFDRAHTEAVKPEVHASLVQPVALPTTAFHIGQIRVTPQPQGGWLLCHIEDVGREDVLEGASSPYAARAIATCDHAGQFRALKTAPTLKRGWKLFATDEDALRLALDFFYPAALGLWAHWQTQTLEPVSLRETLARQTGMYRFANTIRDDQAQDMVACECDASTKCLRRITWRLDATQDLTKLGPSKLPQASPTAASPTELPLLCVEACTHLVSAARAIAQRNYKEKSAT